MVSLAKYRPFRDAFALEPAEMTHLLIVEAQTPSRAELVESLKSRGHWVTAIEDPYALPAALAVHRPEIALLELLLNAEVNSLEFCERLRPWSSIPVIFTSVDDVEPIKVRALDAGADDILIRPFGVDELLAQVRKLGENPYDPTYMLTEAGVGCRLNISTPQ